MAALVFRFAVIAVAVAWSITVAVFGTPVVVRGRGQIDIAAIHLHPGYAVLQFVVIGAAAPLILAIAVAPYVRHHRHDDALFAIVSATLACAVLCAISVAIGVWLVVDATAAPTAELAAIGTLNTLNGICAALTACATITLAHSPTFLMIATPRARLLVAATGYASALFAFAHLATPTSIILSAWIAAPIVLVTSLIVGVEKSQTARRNPVRA
ncbi:hypothetical protein OG579_02835 [Williamsia herbipolensis]|uniref:DUF4386 domain-containing protein n=1 Tax=Williamsia herbipolensis TaxID=1603258 RepID=A0AAU4K424_9NOCA|nr:hypothetical protein [Williamsia herbipolensis]